MVDSKKFLRLEHNDNNNLAKKEVIRNSKQPGHPGDATLRNSEYPHSTSPLMTPPFS